MIIDFDTDYFPDFVFLTDRLMICFFSKYTTRLGLFIFPFSLVGLMKGRTLKALKAFMPV